MACHGRDSSTSYLPVTVFVQDINDNPPVFQSQGLYNCQLHLDVMCHLTMSLDIHQQLEICVNNIQHLDV